VGFLKNKHERGSIGGGKKKVSGLVGRGTKLRAKGLRIIPEHYREQEEGGGGTGYTAEMRASSSILSFHQMVTSGDRQRMIGKKEKRTSNQIRNSTHEWE